ncbi:MAG: site-2 protease family protein [Candidatus Marinimicrobia bacterium]|nr:site-2 protease family protein [Candidatus Neomarinimicrobiota bacterium]
MNFQMIVLLIPPILLALTFHEYMHGYTAYRLGDPTAKYAGRLTFNPLAHLDPIGTLMVFLVHFGWAKPVPVNPSYFHDPKRDMLIVSVAGPAANMVLALLSGILVRFVRAGALSFLPQFILQPIFIMLILSLQINIALAIFNIIPLPPLDGSKILYGMLPHKYDYIIDDVERYGPFILMGVILFGWITKISIIGAFISPFINFFSNIFGGV